MHFKHFSFLKLILILVYSLILAVTDGGNVGERGRLSQPICGRNII